MITFIGIFFSLYRGGIYMQLKACALLPLEFNSANENEQQKEDFFVRLLGLGSVHGP